ncbi:inorganic pyrophosphatase [Coelomomyces lativittatus]|nr:inorganic pyrophosphatase [Coelomomyces lativittatus]
MLFFWSASTSFRFHLLSSLDRASSPFHLNYSTKLIQPFFYPRLLSKSSSSSSSSSISMSTSPSRSNYSVRSIHPKNTLQHRVYFQNQDGTLLSPFHDIPLFSNKEKTIFNMVVEIPRWTNAKLEISKETFLNPIQQDVKKEKLRFVANCFPYHGYIWNYGAFPQTWEDPSHVHPDTQAKGDNDPLDVCELGERVAQVGEIKQVKVVGCLALLDEGETDWKILVIDVHDPMASHIHDIDDVEKHFPGWLQATHTWFRIYKKPDGKPENQFAFNGQVKNKAYALNVIMETHASWQHLIQGEVSSNISCLNTTLDVPTRISTQDPRYLAIPASTNDAPAPVDPSVDKWHFVDPKPNL